MTKSTCKVCNKVYNSNKKNQIIHSLKISLSIDHSDTCIDCIKLELNRIKTSKRDHILKLRQNLDATQIAYEQAGTIWQAEAKLYQDLDYIENMLAFKQKPVIVAPKTEKNNKPTVKKEKKAKKGKLTSLDFAMKALAGLDPAVKEAILANLKKQSS